SGQGISQLHESLEQHLAFQNRTQLRIQKRKRRIENYVRQIVNERIMRKFWESSQQKRLAALIEQILNKQRSPYAVSNELIQEFRKLA
ncbi:MAG: hypothetical protein ONB13_11460, partial [candidate division KSB1 bacterium]|nr:hypothetical protein [candidate division KSB1 bacterium]